jgi:hypothetical protein
MTDAEIAEKVGRERRILRGLIEDLSRAAGTMPGDQHAAWLQELRDKFAHFRAHIHKAMALQEQDGFLREVLTRRPTLERDVVRLKAEYAQLLRLADDIHERLAKFDAGHPILIEDCQLRIRFLLDQLDQHEEQKNLLVTFVFTQDIGAAD